MYFTHLHPLQTFFQKTIAFLKIYSILKLLLRIQIYYQFICRSNRREVIYNKSSITRKVHHWYNDICIQLLIIILCTNIKITNIRSIALLLYGL